MKKQLYKFYNMKKINVLHLSTSKVFGGCEEHIRILAKYIDKRKFRLIVACPEEGDFGKVLKENKVEIVNLSLPHKFAFNKLFLLTDILKRYKIEILHTHNRRGDFFGFLSTRMERLPHLITTVHDRIEVNEKGEKLKFYSRYLHYFILRNFFDKIITVSLSTKENVLNEVKVKPEKVTHIINGIDLEKLNIKIDIKEKKREIGIDEKIKVIGLIARVRGRELTKKGHLCFVKAASYIQQNEKNVVFLIAGEDEKAREYLKEKIYPIGILDKFIFLGYRKDIMEILPIIDILIVPSLFEGLPKIVCEAMGCGVPVIASEVDGIVEVIEDGKNGFLFKPQDEVELAKKTLTILKNPERLKEVSQNAKEKIFKFYDGKIMTSEIETLYEEVLMNKGKLAKSR